MCPRLYNSVRAVANTLGKKILYSPAERSVCHRAVKIIPGREGGRERPPRAVHQPNFYFTILSPPSDESYCASQLLRLFFHSRPFPPLFFFYLCRLASKHAINTVSFSTNPRASSFFSTCILAPTVFLFPPLVAIKQEKPFGSRLLLVHIVSRIMHSLHSYTRARA